LIVVSWVSTGYDQLKGITSYGWVVAVNETVIAKGKGPAEAHPAIAEAYRGEAYGLGSSGSNLSQGIDRILRYSTDETSMVLSH
jgi:hypothetical protein